MNKKIGLVLVFVLLVAALGGTIFASVWFAGGDSDSAGELLLTVSGDIEGFAKDAEISALKAVDFKYEKDGAEISASGYKLSDVLGLVAPLVSGSENNSVLISSPVEGGAGTSALIDMTTSELCFLVENAKGTFNMVAPSHPPVVGIKDVKEISVIAKDESALEDGFRVVTTEYLDSGEAMVDMGEKGTNIYSFGALRRDLFYDRDGAAAGEGIKAYKYVYKNKQITMSDVTAYSKNIVYFDNLHVEKADAQKNVVWQGGRLCYEASDGSELPVFGVVTGTDVMISDVFSKMKQSLQENKKVLFILPDGFSWQQYLKFNDGFASDVFGASPIMAASMNPAISPVGLAAIVTGQSPYANGITSRSTHDLQVEDIFKVASALGKKTIYVEGGGKTLINTSLEPFMNGDKENPDPNIIATSDTNVKDCALKQIRENPDTDFLFVHFHGPDDFNHAYGALSSKSKDQLEWVEIYIKMIMDEFSADVVYIVPDHGHVTYVETTGDKKGNHGMFEKEDMYVPFYEIKKAA